jgi:phosphatidylserine decarboxylase
LIIPITKYGYGLVIGTWVLFFIFLVITVISHQPFYLYITVVLGIFGFINLLFFRDPQRLIPADPQLVLSPADGKVVQIMEVMEDNFIHCRVQRLSIFLSIFNVHVNRSPVSGRVEYFSYRKGSFRPAFKTNASLENEQIAIGIIDHSGRKILFTQIAGIIARRIVCDLREGHLTRAGERMGMIRYGSRVDIYYLPDQLDLKVKIGDKVKGGESIIGVFK